MSAKITVIVYIVISFEIGLLLVFLPWTPWWDDNFFLYFLTGKLQAPWIATFLKHSAIRGAVSGIGLLNVLAGVYDIIKFRESVNKLAALGEPATGTNDEKRKEEEKKETHIDSAKSQAAAVSDHQSPGLPPQARD
ncbi:MAG: hypothetical protein AB7P14_19050 [Blastocatellales bacterium]